MLLTTESLLDKTCIKKHYGTKLISGYPLQLIEFEQSVLIRNVNIIQSIWEYVSVDQIRNNIDFLEIVSLPLKESHIEWIRENMKIESFLNMIGHHYHKVGCIDINTFLNDTFNQLEKLLKINIKVSKPKRWRLIDFHDYVSYLYLKHTTQNNHISTLIHPYSENEYTVSQPKDTLSMIIWGKKVKNCVASYEERIGKNIWIFFIEKDGVPYYTVETDMTKKFNIKQIVSQCNSSVNSDGQSLAQKLILNAVKTKSIAV